MMIVYVPKSADDYSIDNLSIDKSAVEYAVKILNIVAKQRGLSRNWRIVRCELKELDE